MVIFYSYFDITRGYVSGSNMFQLCIRVRTKPKKNSAQAPIRGRRIDDCDIFWLTQAILWVMQAVPGSQDLGGICEL